MLASRYIVMGSPAEFVNIEQGFEQIAGFPGVKSAVDGMLIRALETSKTGTAAKNPPPSMPRLSWTPKVTSDRFLFEPGLTPINRRGMDQVSTNAIIYSINSYVPPGKHLLADTGYKIYGHMLTLFPESSATKDRRNRVYNKYTRAHALPWSLEQKASGRICKAIIGCAVLHNLLTLAKYTVVVGDTDLLTRKARMRTNEGFEYTDNRLSNLQRLSKRNGLADIFYDNM
ncbi:hypothetical protein PHMEG_0009892 [Phytophthora megakarya]|uniref:DDE Tnp4 domain-containing protein n=1 Tax=Phytophthora megakarya TaxID=4795 RepID=A0A225WF21_9STRA|nr:hypothetical protein PHMEG_0009892 [Phytophthora megakarya]